MAVDAERSPISQADDTSALPSYFQNERREMLAYVPVTARRVLDVGCGAGGFAMNVKARGAEVWGVELDPTAARVAAERLDRVVCDDVSGAFATLPRGTFDCIVFNDVLEHLVDPQAALATAKELLAPGGVVACSIPNVRHFRNLVNLIFHKQWRYEDVGTLDRTHLRFFTERSIVDMFEQVGYRILRMDGIGGFTSWKYRLLARAPFGLLSDVFHFQFACQATPR